MKPLSKNSLAWKYRGRSIPEGYRATYFGTKGDFKARMEINAFTHWYKATELCECCCAQQPYKNALPEMNYKNFSSTAAWKFTMITHEMYMQVFSPSPYACINGWHLWNQFRDSMHCMYLGFLRSGCSDLIEECDGLGLLLIGAAMDVKLRC